MSVTTAVGAKPCALSTPAGSLTYEVTIAMRDVIGSLLALLLATTALAAGPRYYVVVDTGGTCSIVHSKPGAHSGLTIMGDKSGYDGLYAAKIALKAIPDDKCKGGYSSRCSAPVAGQRQSTRAWGGYA